MEGTLISINNKVNTLYNTNSMEINVLELHKSIYIWKTCHQAREQITEEYTIHMYDDSICEFQKINF